MRTAIEQGMADALAELAALQKRIDAKEVTSGEMFGTREYLKNNYLYRMAGAVNGIYGNSAAEAIYPLLALDDEGQKPDGSQKYTLRFAPGQLPPVNAFWSLTMYRMPEILLVDNPIDRYLLNSPMLSQFKRDADGGLTLYIQNESPGKDKESNWLPAPKGWFMVVMRLYWPKEEALERQMDGAATAAGQVARWVDPERGVRRTCRSRRSMGVSNAPGTARDSALDRQRRRCRGSSGRCSTTTLAGQHRLNAVGVCG